MSSEPPGSGDVQEEGPATEPSGDHVDRRASGGRQARWRASIATAIGVLAVAGGVGAFLFLNQNSGSKPGHVATALGLACPYLEQAADAYKKGDHLAYNRAISEAAHVAEETLQTYGQTFGEPERIALELRLERHRSGTATLDLLSTAQAACSGRSGGA